LDKSGGGDLLYGGVGRASAMEKRLARKRVEKTQQPPLIWETDYVAAEQNLETIGYFSATAFS
jgi:hypothetical protein